MSSPWGDNRSFVCHRTEFTNQIINANWRMTSIQAGHNPFISLYANIYTPQVHKMIAARIWVVFYTSINVGIDGNFNLETTHVTRGVDTEKTWRLVHKNCHSRLQIKDLLLSLNPPGLNL
jgi:hypothetical protein